MKKAVQTTIERTKSLLRRQGAWCQNLAAVDGLGWGTSPTDGRAVRWSLPGALRKAADGRDPSVLKDAAGALVDAVYRLEPELRAEAEAARFTDWKGIRNSFDSMRVLEGVNDRTSHGSVLRVIDDALKRGREHGTPAQRPARGGAGAGEAEAAPVPVRGAGAAAGGVAAAKTVPTPAR